MVPVRSYLPLLRAVAIVADVVLLIFAAWIFFQRQGGPLAPLTLEGMQFFAVLSVGPAASLAVLLMVKSDPEVRQLEAAVHKAELRKRLRELDEAGRQDQ